MRRGRLAFLPLTIGPLLALAAAAPATASTLPGTLPTLPISHSRSTTTVPDLAASALAGFVLWNGSAVTHQTSYNSAGGVVTVSPGTTGTYLVTFFELGFHSGDVQVSSGSISNTCAVQNWGYGSNNLTVNVDCYDPSGAPANSPFDLLVTQPKTAPNGVLDFDWVFTGAHGPLTGAYQYNSSHRTNSVTHPRVGQYVVTMPGPGLTGASAGTVKVSPYGTDGGSCQVASWRSTSTGQQIAVDCFDATGVLQNRQFTVVYARANNLMGQNGKIDANAAVIAGGTVYQPRIQYDSQPGARITAAHLNRGLYEILYAGTHVTGHFSGGLGHVEITPVGSVYHRCSVGFVPTHVVPEAIVGCVNAAGHASDSPFLLQLVVN